MSVITRSGCARVMRLVASAHRHADDALLLGLAACPSVGAGERNALRILAADKTRAVADRIVGLQQALLRAVAVRRSACTVDAREPWLRRASRKLRINRSIRRRRGITTTNEQRSNQHVTHSAIVHDVADTCAAIGKAVQL